jgi:hypothetical protein
MTTNHAKVTCVDPLSKGDQNKADSNPLPIINNPKEDQANQKTSFTGIALLHACSNRQRRIWEILER